MVVTVTVITQPARNAHFDETSSVASSVDLDQLDDMECPCLGVLPRQTSTYSTASVVLPGADMKHPTPMCSRWADEGCTDPVALEQPLEDECEFEFDEPIAEKEDAASTTSTVVHTYADDCPAAPAPSPTFIEAPAQPKVEAFQGLTLGDLSSEDELDEAEPVHVAVEYRHDPYSFDSALVECYVCPCSECAPRVAAVLNFAQPQTDSSTGVSISDYTPSYEPSPAMAPAEIHQQQHMAQQQYPYGLANQQYDGSVAQQQPQGMMNMQPALDDGMGMPWGVPQQGARTDSQEYWAPAGQMQCRQQVVAPGMEQPEPSSEPKDMAFVCVPPPRLTCRDVFEEDGASYDAAHAMTYALAMRWYKRTKAVQHNFLEEAAFCPELGDNFDEWLEGCMAWWRLHFADAQKRPAAVAAAAVSMRAAAAGARPASGRGFQSHTVEERQPLQPSRARRF